MKGQDYIPLVQDGAWWHVTSSSPAGVEKLAFIISGDTTINGKNYRFFDCFRSPPFCSNCFIHGYIREDTTLKKVFYLEESFTEEKLWYDFSLEQGDTIELDWYTDFFFENYSAVVDTVYYEFIFGQSRKVIDFIPEGIEFFYPGCDRIIEGVGLPAHAYPYESFCQDETLELLTNVDSFALIPEIQCSDIILSSENQMSPNEINVYPSPASKSVNINIPHNWNSMELSIYSLSGQVVMVKNVSGPSFNLNTTNLPSGFYILSLNLGNNNIANKKILIHH
ncbi:MAG: T9SS type A sorting domain-containing protein [Bacteroidota bacterium]